MKSTRIVPLLLLATCGFASNALAQRLGVSYNTPTLDRWMYPFNSQPGREQSIPTLGAIRIDGFDDRDAQFLVGFDTAQQIPPGLELNQYRIESVILRAQ